MDKEKMLNDYYAKRRVRPERNGLEWLTVYFGGAEGAFQENIHDVDMKFKSVWSHAVDMGQSLVCADIEPKEQIKAMEREVNDLLAAVLTFRYRVAALSALLWIKEDER